MEYSLHMNSGSEFELRRQHAFNKLEFFLPPDAPKGRFLDIGCGVGNGVVAALQSGFSFALGIDRNFEEFSWFDIKTFDAICENYQVDSSKALMLEADLFQTGLPPRGFDCVFLLDSIEHVPDPMRFLEEASKYVAPNGYLLVDTCPLFYSQQGHHLFNHIPIDEYPWAHLRNDFQDLIDKYKVDDWSIERFNELNKVTHERIRQKIISMGYEIHLEERGKNTTANELLLERDLAFLNLEGIERERVVI